MVIGYIYKISNNVNNKLYIGQTSSTIKDRWKEHVSCANNGIKTKLYQAMRKYGIINFKIEVIHVCYSDCIVRLKENLNKFEDLYINAFDSLENGYNSVAGGDLVAEQLIKKKMYNANPYEWNRKSQYKPVCMYDLYGKFIDKYDSIGECAEKNQLSPSNIGEVCNGIDTQHRGYYFQFYNGKNDHDIEINVNFGERVGSKYFKIAQYDIEGNLIKIWDNVKEICEFMKIKNTSKILRCCKGKDALYRKCSWKFIFPNNANKVWI